MKRSDPLHVALVLAAFAWAPLAGCGPSQAERYAQQQRIAEVLAQHDRERRLQVEAALSTLRTKAELVTQLGMPRACEPVGEELEACEWQVREAEYHETRRPGSTLIYEKVPGAPQVAIHDPPTETRQKITGAMMALCVVPTDGSERTGECKVWYE